MAKIVKDLNEAQNKGYVANPSSPQSPNGIADILKEANKLIAGINELRNNNPQQQQQTQEPVQSSPQYKSMSAPTEDKNLNSKKKDELKETSEMAKEEKPKMQKIIFNSKKFEANLDMLIQKDAGKYGKWTLEDLKKNYAMAKMFLMPKITAMVQESIEVTEQ